MRCARRRRRGFTLMEVLLVLAILVILGSLVGFAFTRLQKSSYERAARVQIDSFGSGLDTYYLHLSKYPVNLEDLLEQPSGDEADRWEGPYLDDDIPLDPWGNEYKYEAKPDKYGNPSYVITSGGANGSFGDDDDISNRDD